MYRMTFLNGRTLLPVPRAFHRAIISPTHSGDWQPVLKQVYQRATNVERRARSEKGQSGKRRVGLQN